MKKKIFKLVAHTVFLSLGYQLVFPVCAYALTTGPSQPEVQSFEPVGTTEMVDMFSGDFNYNIPLLDVEGYPVNIFYHSGVGIEQEASWVGLGWNINPGEINRTVRGIPDDFNGEFVEKYTKVKNERDIRIGIGSNVALELLGKDLSKELGAKLKLSLGYGFYVNHNNYKGLSAGITITPGINLSSFDPDNNLTGGSIGANVGIGVGSQSGADIDFDASASMSKRYGKNDEYGGGASGGGGIGFNSRSGLKAISFSVTPTTSTTKEITKKDNTTKVTTPYGASGTDVGVTIPIGMQNYVPVIANQVYQSAYGLQIKVGQEQMSAFPSAYIDAMVSNISYEPNGTRRAYGYLYSENARQEDLLDFSREKDGSYNKTMKNLPMGANTYDIYSVNGQGTGGMFRSFRNDIGTVYDPYIGPEPASQNYNGLIELGIGNAFEAGGDLTTVTTRNSSGPWTMLKYGGNVQGSLYEKAFFKQGGDLAYNQQQEAAQVFNTSAQYLLPDMQSLAPNNYERKLALPNYYNNTRILWDNNTIDRSSRSTHIAAKTGFIADIIPELQQSKQIVSYENGTANHFYDPKLKKWDRNGGSYNMPSYHICEFTQTQADGRRYVYGIPAINNATREVTFAIDENKANLNNGYVGFSRGVDDQTTNQLGRDNFYSATSTPAYAHSYLLTNVLSNDYVDILGDGPTDDDPGTFVKFNYTLSDSDYRWRTPYHKDSAQYNPGFWSDSKDGKGNYIAGSRQQWYVRSIESKNYIAEFYTSKRKDARGIQDSILPFNNVRKRFSKIDLTVRKADTSYSYKLDSIVLYNKHDRYINKENAIPIKTVIMQYDYSLCPSTPNSVADTKGKLTLKRLYIKYGQSQKNLLSPYVFDYNAPNLEYNFAAKDRWGNYKAIVPGTYNFEFPYTSQPDDPTANNLFNGQLAAWTLTDIRLPSGGKLHVDYESDDYSFVQDRRAMQMMKIDGVGGSKNYEKKNALYHNADNINDYIYFKRRKSQERSGLSFRDNYLEGQDLLYYSFALDIIGRGKFEQVKGYARIDDVNICPNNSDYGYIKLKRDNVKKMDLHPATIYGINMARCYMPHLFYDGYEESSDIKKIIKGLAGAGAELVNMLVMQNPFKRFINQQKAKYLNLTNSSIRLQTPCLTKKGGGIRVKQLSLSDNWSSMSGGQDASFGKKYDYTITDPRYGQISSGVASYEPMVGADENPFRRPVPYAADQGRLLPSVDFFQEEPFGETFFPGASVGYSSIKVSSIHQTYGRSAQALDEYLFYTAKDFPVRVDYTPINGEKDSERRTLMNYYKEAEVLQGYSIVLNDMHGKPKAVNNYTIQQDGANSTLRKITGVTYRYRTDANNKNLDNTVTALHRKRGTANTYELKSVKLGQDMDISFDSRQRYTNSSVNKTHLNLNTFIVFGIPIFPFTVFHSERYKSISFKSLVTTKIIQQYGILRSVEQFDHDAVTTTENLVYDGETGGVLLARTSNQYNDFTYNRKDPAYFAYEGMRPAYTNMDYEVVADSLVITDNRDGFIYVDHMERFSPGDELLVANSLKDGRFGNKIFKLWIIGKGRESDGTEPEIGSPEDPPIPSLSDSGDVIFWKRPDAPYYGMLPEICPAIAGPVNVTVWNTVGGTLLGNAIVTIPAPSTTAPACGSINCYTLKLPTGSYYYSSTGSAYFKDGPFYINNGACTNIPLTNCPTTIILSGEVPPTGGGSVSNRCGLKVVPRYKDQFAPGTSSPNISTWPLSRTTFKNVTVRVIRSGRRNNLDKAVQQTAFANPGTSAYDAMISGISNYFDKTTPVISVSAQTYTDTASLYHPFTNTINIPGGYGYGQFNVYVLGLRGNYRPLASYAPISQRTYTQGHERYDGSYTLAQPFWLFSNGAADTSCNNKTDILRMNSLTGTQFWKKASQVTRYDVYGNALEEQDANGNYTAAQYGYNKTLPVAVATNTRAQQFMFDGFEDYNNLVPQTMQLLYKNNDLYSTYGKLLGGILPDISAAYPSEAAAPGNPSAFSRYGQQYNLRKCTNDSSMNCSRETSHTGYFSLKCTASNDFKFDVRPLRKDIAPFSMAFGKKYILNLWVKSADPYTPITASTIQAKVYGGLFVNMKVKTTNLDGWYQLETTLDLSRIVTLADVTLRLPANIYIDDIRILPAEGNMKSFVYDPLTHRLMAQLDENHFATFYEYDQEGLLIRTKKETQKGIVTISESRRANVKQNP